MGYRFECVAKERSYLQATRVIAELKAKFPMPSGRTYWIERDEPLPKKPKRKIGRPRKNDPRLAHLSS